MKRTVAISFVIFYMMAVLRPMLPYLEYSLNKDYIKTVLCIDKDEPMSMCEGSCYLDKRIQEESDKSQESDAMQLSTEKYPIDFMPFFSYELSSILTKNETTTSEYLNNYDFLFIKNVLQPPRQNNEVGHA